MTVDEALRKKRLSVERAVQLGYKQLTGHYNLSTFDKNNERHMFQKVVDDMTRNGVKWGIVGSKIWRAMPEQSTSYRNAQAM